MMRSACCFLLLATAIVAQPHGHARHQHQNHKARDLKVVWETETEWVTDIVGVTTTVWVSPGYVAPVETTASAKSTTTIAAESTTTSAPAAEFFQGASSTILPASTPVSVATTSIPVFVAQASDPVETLSSSSIFSVPVVDTPLPISSTPVYVAPAASSSSTAIAVVVSASPEVVVSTPVSTYSAPAVVPTPAIVSTTASSSSGDFTSGSTSGTCEGSGSACQGDITYYTAGLGACGDTSDGNTENVIALPYEFMGTQSNGNPYCGKTVTIYCVATGKSTQATVVDKCMGCTGRSIDLSIKAMEDLDPNYETVGRETAVWWFT